MSENTMRNIFFLAIVNLEPKDSLDYIQGIDDLNRDWRDLNIKEGEGGLKVLTDSKAIHHEGLKNSKTWVVKWKWGESPVRMGWLLPFSLYVWSDWIIIWWAISLLLMEWSFWFFVYAYKSPRMDGFFLNIFFRHTQTCLSFNHHRSKFD